MMDINDIYLFQEILNKIFSTFYKDKEYKQLDPAAFFAFEGVPELEIDAFFEKSTLNKCFPNELSPKETFIVAACLASFYNPNAFSGAKYLLKLDESLFMTLGGKIIGDNKCFYPTGDTLLFLLAGHNISKRHQLEGLLAPDSILFTYNLLNLVTNEPGTPQLTGQIHPTDELLSIVKGHTFRPEFSSNFPASKLETRMDWDDLVLPYETYESLEELKIWMSHGKFLIEHKEIGKRVKPGYRCLFYGPPGTGKTLTASLIGKKYGLPVYRIDLSMVVSKWVGETEKNLGRVFDQATNKKWILFFDEADSLFGKRTSTSSSNDRYANQEVSYLLQRIEEFPGLVILASNLKSNIDEAFNRRFQSTILFPMPNSEIRYLLWQKAFPKDFPLEPKIDLDEVARKFELSGGAITNVVRFCILKALNRKEGNVILFDDIEHALIRERKKVGKIY